MHAHGMYDRPNMSEPLVFSDDIKIFSRNSKRSIFVRDLPYCCTSADLGDFFSHALNTPVLHAMVCRNKQGRTLQIGYVLFQSEEAVRLSLETLNGCRFIGRDIRVLPYDPKAPSEPSTTGLVHVSFKTTTTQQPLVTEATIRRAFETYGELEHVAIRTHKYTDTGLQGGYGFVTFRRPELNRYVIEQVRQLEANGVFYECSWSSLHTHKGATGEEVVIDPRYGYIATKAAGAAGPGPIPSSRGLNDPYGSGNPPMGGFVGQRGGGRDRNYPPYGPEYDDYAYGRRDPREEYYYRGGGGGGVLPPAGPYDRVGGGYGPDYDRRGLRNPYPPVGGGLPPPPPRAYYDEPYYDDYYRGSRGHVSGRPPYAGGRDAAPLYDRGYYEETYRGSSGARFGPTSLAPRPAMSGRDSLDFPLAPGGLLAEDRFALGHASSRLGPENDLFAGLPSRPSVLGEDGGVGYRPTIPGGIDHPGANPVADRDSLSVLNSAGINSSRRSVDSIAAVTDTTDFSFDLGRGTAASSLSASAYDFYPSTLPAGATAASLPPAVVAQAPTRPSRSSWGTDAPADFSRENSEVAQSGLPTSNIDSFWQSTADFFQNKDKSNAVLEEPLEPLSGKVSSSNISSKTDALDALIDPVEDDEEVVPRCASLNGPPPGLLTSTPTSKEITPREEDEDDAVSVPPYRHAEVLDLAKDLELKAIIQPDN